MKNWFHIKAQQSDGPAEISIHDAIGSWNISAQSFLAQLKTITAKQITITMNSPGGSVMDGIAIYNGLRHHAEKTGAEITVQVLGIVASISSVIAMAAHKIKMPKNTFMMVHSPSASLYANAAEMRDMADLLDKFESSLISTYVARTGKTAEEVKALLDAETFMTADEAVAMGFADEVTDALKVEASFDLENLPENIVNIFKAAENKSTPDPEPEAAPKASLASQIDALAKDFGLQDHVETWLLDVAIDNVDQAKAAMTVACEIKELCVLAKVPDMTSTLIETKASLNDARSKICAAKAEASDAIKVDNHQPNPSSKQPTSVPQAAKSTAEVYAARKPK